MRILQGRELLNKTSNLMESMIPSKVKHSFSNIESQHLAHDGKIYAIVKENADFVLKVANKSNPEKVEDFDYINGLGNKSKNVKRTYNESVRILNLMDVEFKRLYGSRLVEEYAKSKEQLDEKTVLKIKNPSPSTSTASEIPMGNDDMSADAVPEMSNDGSDEFGDSETNDAESLDNGETSDNPDDYSDVDPDDLGTDDPEKMIQKLSGKLAYELRDFDDSDKYSNVAKFAMSMATSALQTDKMSDSDKNSIEKKLTAKFDGSGDSEDGQSVDAENSDELDFDSEPTADEGQDLNKQESFKVSKGKLLEMFKNIKPTKKIVKENIFFEFADEFDMADGFGFYNEPIDELTEEDLDLDVDDEFDDMDSQYNQYDVPQEKILFDIEEDIYSEPIKVPKNKQFQTSIGNVNVGRIDGDDDYIDVVNHKSKFSITDTKRNPFKYNK